jgi:PPP family 3-phenylpropionic acid transporter
VLDWLRYIQLYFLLFAGYALHVTYLTLFYQRRGFDYWQISVLEAIGAACVTLSAFVWGPVSDRLRRKRRLLGLLSLGMGLFFPLLWLAPNRFWLMAPLAAGLYLCRAPLVPLLDSAFFEALAAKGDRSALNYSRVRLFGSLGFIVAGSLLPLMLSTDPSVSALARLQPVFVAFTLCALATALVAFRTPDPPRPESERIPARDYRRAVLAVPQYKRLLVVLLVSWLSNQAYYMFLSLYLDQIGVSDRMKGLYWSMGVLAEVCLLAAGPWLLRRFGVRKLLLAGLVGRCVRLFGFSVRQAPLVVLLVFQPMHALAFAATHLATMAFLERTVPPHLRATGQMLNAGLVTGAGGFLGSLLAGRVSQGTLAPHGALFGLRGINAAYLVCAFLQFGVLAVAARTLREPPNAVE